jgi:ABC-2 type transport system ATP-binding protein
LLGHNGAGKTTLMRMITGALETTSGSIQVGGFDVDSEPLKTHALIGYLPEQLPLYPEMTVVQYLHYCASIRGISQQDCKQEIQRVIAQTHLQDKALQRIETLSRGYKQRTGVAQALLGSPKLLILDEPTNGLDPDQTAQMRALIASLRQYATVILSTHIMQEVNAVCDRVLIIRKGELALDESLANLASNHALRLDCQAGKAAVEDIAKTLGFIGKVEILPGGTPASSLRLHVHADTAIEKACAQLVRALTQKDIDIYSIQPEKRDLETLFHQINADQGVQHAA